MSDIADVPPAVVGRLRVICGELPEAYEEPAWIGLRWRIRRRTFLHVYTTVGRRSAYIELDGPAILMTFRAPPGELAALAHAGPPFFRADWGMNVVGMVLDDETDWVEAAELVTNSYRVQAPRRLCDGLAGEQEWDVLLEVGDFRADGGVADEGVAPVVRRGADDHRPVGEGPPSGRSR